MRHATYYVALFVAASFMAAVFASHVYAAGILTFISDLISTSAPATLSTHTVQFTLANNIPPSGSFTITPESGAFDIPAAFDYTDVDFGYSTTSISGPYTQRPVDAVADATNDGVSVVTGSSGSITITLNSTEGLTAGDMVQVKLGTNATFGTSGSENITNPGTVDQSYRIDVETRDDSNVLIDSALTLIRIISPVTLTVNQPIVEPVRFNGLPSGLIAAGNTRIELSLETDIFATCRYATTTDILYDDMLGFFGPGIGKLFYVDTTGYQNDTTYNYYVRCKAIAGGTNITDFPITFTLKPTPISNTSILEDGVPTTGPTGDLGRGGSGEFPSGSNVLYYATVTFSGTTVPGGQVTVLKDGVKAVTVGAQSTGAFETTLTGLERGTYGFQLFVQDSHGRMSSLYGTTMTFAQGTNNEVTNIVMPPTIDISTDSIGSGDPVDVFGSAPPNSKVQVMVVARTSAIVSTDDKVYSATSTGSGDWTVALDTSDLIKGTYVVQAQVVTNSQSKSGLSKAKLLQVGATIGGKCGSPDMNTDGKVNLIDFSIFLLSWDTTDAKADFSCDGKVNLGDFSIMLFNWTG